MIVCPQCKHEELPGAIFCSECGTQLVHPSHGDTISISPEKAWAGKQAPAVAPAPALERRGRLAIHLVDSGILVPLEGGHEFTFGRLSEGQPVIPDVDLSAYKAYENGVSRLHAVIRLDGNQLTIMDLGSSNGTYVNGTRLISNREQHLSSGDLVALGKLRFQLVFNAE